MKLYGDITSSLDAVGSRLKSIEAGRKVSFPDFNEKNMTLLLLFVMVIVKRKVSFYIYLDGKIFWLPE